MPKIFSSESGQKKLSVAIRLVLAVFLMLYAVFPVLYIFSSSINPVGTLGSQRLIPENPTFDNYRELLTSQLFPFNIWITNSLKVSGITTILSLMITTLTAFAFSRFRFAGRQNLLKTILLVQVFPGMLAMIALYLLVQQIGIQIPFLGLNTHGGLILVYLGGAMGINIWLMKGFFDTVPREIDESAMVDGATHWQTFWYLIFPLVRPILVVVGILSFIGTYGDFVLARVLLKSTEQYTLMVGLSIFTSGQFAQNWKLFTAGAMMGALPVMIIYLLLQDQIVGGLTQGSVKG